MQLLIILVSYERAANWVEGKEAGCGTIGNAKSPYPVAYNFLTDAYQEKLPYDQYLKLFENILHINLIKLIEGACV